MAKGNSAFKLSDLLPNSWLYKLKNMRSRGDGISRENGAREAGNSKDNSKISREEPPKSPAIQQYTAKRLSYYIPSRERTAEKLPVSPSLPKKSKAIQKNKPMSSSVLTAQPTPATPLRRLDGVFDTEVISPASANYAPSLHLPPILTKPPLITRRKQSSKQGSGNIKSPSGTQQIKLRIKSPKLVHKRVVRRKEFSDSLVVVKSSSDPKKDFRESMVDMIAENNLFSRQELEELLACYLLLNSSEFHDLIIEVFEKIWFDITEIIV